MRTVVGFRRRHQAGHTITTTLSILDTGATVLRTLGLDTYTEWDSHPVEEIFRSPRTAAADPAQLRQPLNSYAPCNASVVLLHWLRVLSTSTTLPFESARQGPPDLYQGACHYH